uniref:C2 domain-containing protein n=1 Tax=Tanacetum cinerariifolium TaxID=118510 RepID=A0A699GJ60_TANCI|nr:hypothetical protein [Tanacetum cinerariifolium]
MILPVRVEDVKQEVKILRALSDHENVVQFHNAFEEDYYMYIAMESLELTLISAEGLKKPSSSSKFDKVYATFTITGFHGKLQTPTDKNNPKPMWNHPMQITIDEAAAGQKRRMLVFKIKALRTFFDNNLGEVRVLFKELMEGMNDEGKDVQIVTYIVNRGSKKPGGTVTFSYKFGPKFIKL